MSARRKPKAARDLAAVLLQLDQQMEAGHLSPAHPWRVLIADAMPHDDAAPGARPAHASPAAEGATFFDLNCTYLIAPSATLADLLKDYECLQDSAMGALEGESFDDFSSGQWAGVYMLQQAGAVAKEIARRVWAGERIERGTP